MKILVTGSSGMIGSHVAGALCADGHDVIGVDILEPDLPCPWNIQVSDIRAIDIHADSTLVDFDACVHLAAFGGVARAQRAPRFIFESNVDATIHLVDWLLRMPHLRRVIHASSFSVYGNAPVPTTTEAPIAPRETYAASKAAQELAFVGSGLPVTVLRFSSVYGQRMRLADEEATIMAKLAGWISRGEEFQINEDGHQTRDFVYVGDVVSAIRVILSGKHSCPPVLNVCTGEAVSLRKAIEVLSNIIGKPARVSYTGVARPGDMRHCLGDAGGLRALLGREPTPFSLGAIEAFGGLAS